MICTKNHWNNEKSPIKIYDNSNNNNKNKNKNNNIYNNSLPKSKSREEGGRSIHHNAPLPTQNHKTLFARFFWRNHLQCKEEEANCSLDFFLFFFAHWTTTTTNNIEQEQEQKQDVEEDGEGEEEEEDDHEPTNDTTNNRISN